MWQEEQIHGGKENTDSVRYAIEGGFLVRWKWERGAKNRKEINDTQKKI